MSISRAQALDCFVSHDLIGIGMEADAVRRRLHPEGVVTYAIERRIDLSHRTDDLSAIYSEAAEVLNQGGTGLTLHGAGGWPLERLEDLLRELRRRVPELHLHCFSAPEILMLASMSSLSLADTLRRLKDAGLGSIPGAGAMLPGAHPWLEVHQAAHLAGIPTTASMTIGGGESAEERVAFLEELRSLQQATCGFQAFTLETHASSRELDDATAVEYLKTLAICRMLLDNIPNVEANWRQQGLKVLQMGLRFGGNDAGSTHNAEAAAPEEELRRIIRDAGFRPAQRDTLYRAMFLN